MAWKIVLTICALLFCGLIFLISDIKNAYKVLPINASKPIDVSAFANWREFQPPSQRFKALLPAPPQYVKESVVIPDTEKKRLYEMYVSEKLNGTVFMISLITYPKDFLTSRPFEMLNDIVDEMIQNKPANKLKKREDVFFQNHEAVEFTIKNDKFDIQGTALMVDRTIYLLSYIASHSEFSSEDYQYFIDSFKVLPKGEISSVH